MIQAKRYNKNPILKPNEKNFWESKAVFNPGAAKIKDKVYLFYRALSKNNVSSIGLLVLDSDGLTILEKLDKPIYTPRHFFERREKENILKLTGVEDPRITIIGKKIYMLYTALPEKFDYVRVAITSIKIKDFLKRNFDKWEEAKLVSPPAVWDKDAALLSKKFRGKYVIFHRFFPDIWVDFVRDLEFKNYWIRGERIIRPRENFWDSDRIGIAAEPIKTTEGYVMIYHGRSKYDGKYRLGALLLDKEDLITVRARLPYPILEPKEWYEREGIVNEVVFCNGHVLIDDTLFIYYGAADKYIGIAYLDFNELVGELLKYSDY